MHSRPIEVYWLPPGGIPGSDELPLHGDTSYINIEASVETASLPSWSDHNGQDYPAVRDYHVTVGGIFTPEIWPHRKSIGNIIDLYGGSGRGKSIITVLYGDKPDAFHIPHLIAVSTDVNADAFEVSFMGLNSRRINGTYTVNALIGIVRSDNGDGTYHEKDLIREIALDEWVSRRYNAW